MTAPPELPSTTPVNPVPRGHLERTLTVQYVRHVERGLCVCPWRRPISQSLTTPPWPGPSASTPLTPTYVLKVRECQGRVTKTGDVDWFKVHEVDVCTCRHEGIDVVCSSIMFVSVTLSF